MHDRCDCQRLYADEAEQQVWAEVSRRLADPSKLMALAAEYLSVRGEQEAGQEGDTVDLDGQIERLEAARSRPAAAVKAGLDPQLLAAIGAIDGELAVLRCRASQAAALREQTAPTRRGCGAWWIWRSGRTSGSGR